MQLTAVFLRTDKVMVDLMQVGTIACWERLKMWVNTPISWSVNEFSIIQPSLRDDHHTTIHVVQHNPQSYFAILLTCDCESARKRLSRTGLYRFALSLA